MKNLAHALSAASGTAVAGALTFTFTLLVALAAHAESATNTQVRVSSFEYDANGLLIKEVVEPEHPEDCLQTSYGYDGYGNRVSASSAVCAGATGHTVSSAASARTASATFAQQTVTVGGVSFTSAAGTFPTRITNALGQSESREYDPRHGGLIKLTGPNGGITTWNYDGFGRKTRENRSDGTQTAWAYKLCQVAGQPRDALCPASVGPHAVVWYFSEASFENGGAAASPIKYQFHDTLDRVVRAQTQDFHGQTVVQDTHYNSLGQISQKSIFYRLSGGTPHWSAYTYDRLGRVITETGPDGNGGQARTSVAYSGLVTTVTNPQGQTQARYRNATGQAARIVDHLGNEVIYTHDALGQLIQTSAAGAVTRISYTRRGHKASMQDPAMGAWNYAYNAFGELVWQQDSLSQTTTMAYDALGRMVQRTEPDLVSRWHHDKNANGTACGAGIGKLCEATVDNGYRRLHTYDALGRPTRTDTALDSATSLATVSQTYHPLSGRVASKTWPTGYRASYTYNALGYLSKVTGGGVTGHPQVASLDILAMDPQGRVTQYRQGNNVTTVNAYDQPSGNLNSVQATLQGQGAGKVLNHSYSYDKLGNLLTRSDANSGVTESFQYDSLNRLGMYTVLGGGLAGTQRTQMLYDAAGNLKYKSDVGYYHYDTQRPNRLNQITLAPEANWSAIGAVTQANTGTRSLSYSFDEGRPGTRSITTAANTSLPMGNGNLWYTVSQDQASGRHTVRWETYTSFNMPREILLGNLSNNATNSANPTATVAERTLSFAYGPEHQRIRQSVQLISSAPSHMQSGTTWYLNGEDSQGLSYEKEIKANGTTEHKHYLNAGGIPFAQYIKREGNLNGKPATSVNYFHQDHLGSIAAISDEQGAVTERLAYAPWGKRRYPNGVSDVADAIQGVNTDRGYTMHEHLDEMGITHMNGRIYDPLVGRFMSADPFVKNPGNLQNFNRYSYVLNNPLKYVDPSGYNEDCPGHSHACDGTEHEENNESEESQGTLPEVTVTASPEPAGPTTPPWTVVNGHTGVIGGTGPELTVTARAELVGAGMVLGGMAGTVAASGCTVGTGGLCSLGAPSIVGAGVAAGGALGAGLGQLADWLRGLFKMQWALSVDGANSSEQGKDSKPQKPEGVPEDWVEVPSRDGKGTKWVAPSNPKGGDYVRERGDGTLTQVKNGRALDSNGNAASGLSSPEAHFPRDQWTFRP